MLSWQLRHYQFLVSRDTTSKNTYVSIKQGAPFLQGSPQELPGGCPLPSVDYAIVFNRCVNKQWYSLRVIWMIVILLAVKYLQYLSEIYWSINLAQLIVIDKSFILNQLIVIDKSFILNQLIVI